MPEQRDLFPTKSEKLANFLKDNKVIGIQHTADDMWHVIMEDEETEGGQTVVEVFDRGNNLEASPEPITEITKSDIACEAERMIDGFAEQLVEAFYHKRQVAPTNEVIKLFTELLGYRLCITLGADTDAYDKYDDELEQELAKAIKFGIVEDDDETSED